HHGSEAVLDAGAARKDIPHLVDRDAAARSRAPGDEKVAASAIQTGEREPLAPALRRRSDLRHLHERIPKPSAVDADIRKIGHLRPPPPASPSCCSGASSSREAVACKGAPCAGRRLACDAPR